MLGAAITIAITGSRRMLNDVRMARPQQARRALGRRSGLTRTTKKPLTKGDAPGMACPWTVSWRIWEFIEAEASAGREIEDRVRLVVDEQCCLLTVLRPNDQNDRWEIMVDNRLYIIDMKRIDDCVIIIARIDSIKISRLTLILEDHLMSLAWSQRFDDNVSTYCDLLARADHEARFGHGLLRS